MTIWSKSVEKGFWDCIWTQGTIFRGVSCLTHLGVSACIPFIRHLCLKCHHWLQETESGPQLALNNGTYSQSLTCSAIQLTAMCEANLEIFLALSQFLNSITIIDLNLAIWLAILQCYMNENFFCLIHTHTDMLPRRKNQNSQIILTCPFRQLLNDKPRPKI